MRFQKAWTTTSKLNYGIVDINALGNIYRGGTIECISNDVSRYENQAKNAEVHSVILLAGTNNVGDGDDDDDVFDKLSSLLSTANKSFSKSNIIMSSSHHRVDLKPEIGINRKCDNVNSAMRQICKDCGVLFVDNNVKSSYKQPDTFRLNHGGLHLNASGRMQLARRIISMIKDKNCVSQPAIINPRNQHKNKTDTTQRQIRGTSPKSFQPRGKLWNNRSQDANNVVFHGRQARIPLLDKTCHILSLIDLPVIPPQPSGLFCPRPQYMNMNKIIPVNQGVSLPPMSQQCVPIPINALLFMLFH